MKNLIKKIYTAVTQRGPIGWVRRFLNTVKTYHANMQIMAAHVDELSAQVAETRRYVKRATKVHVDVSGTAKESSQVIVCGLYRGRDYVRTFNVSHGSLEELIKWLTGISQYARIGRLDTPPQIDAAVRRELNDRGVEF